MLWCPHHAVCGCGFGFVSVGGCGVLSLPAVQIHLALLRPGLLSREGAESWCLSVTFQLKAQAIAAGVSARQAWLGARALDALHVPTVQAFMQNKHPPVPCLRPGGGGGGSPRDKGSCARNSPKIFPLDKKNFSLGGIFDGPPVRSDPGSHLPTGIGRTSAAVR